MNTQATLGLLLHAIRQPLSVTSTQTTTMLRALTHAPVRDALIALAVGRPDDAGALISERPPTSASWLTCGPIDKDEARRAIPLLNHLEAEARAAGAQYTWAPATIHAYLDWATGHPIAAARRLTTVPSSYSMAAVLKQLIALGAPTPRILAPSDSGTTS